MANGDATAQERAAVGEAIRGDVQDPHEEGATRQIERLHRRGLASGNEFGHFVRGIEQCIGHRSFAR